MILQRVGLALTVSVLSIGTFVPAVAQEEPRSAPFTVRPAPRGPEEQSSEPFRGETVVSRSRPEYDPLGVRLGGFYLFPQLNVFETWNDNIFASKNDEKSDFITNVAPAMSLQSDWGRHALNFSAGSNSALYSTYTRQDYTEYFANANGRADISNDSALFAGGGYAHRFLFPGTPDFQGAARQPTPYNTGNGFLQFNQNFGRIRTVTGGEIERIVYDDDTLQDGSKASNADNDRTNYTGSVRVGYELFPNYEVFVQGSGNRREYDDHDNVGTLNKSSTGYNAITGVALDLGGIVFGEIYVGYLQQIYDESAYTNTGGVDAGGSLTWNVTTLTTITARATRQISETTQDNVSGIFTTTTSLDVDHELLRNLILNANFAFVSDKYENINRDDEYYIAGVGARYLINRNFSANLGYRFVQRDSNLSNEEYTRNLVRIGLQAQL